MFNFLKRKNKKKPNVDYDDGKVKQISSVYHDKNNTRFLKLPNSACSIVLYDNNTVEVICTKLDDNQQIITDNEMTLMSFAMMLKQPGFGEMLRNQFKNVAMDKFSSFDGEHGENTK